MAVTASRPLSFRRGDYYAHKIILPMVDEDDNAIDWTTAEFASQIRDGDTLIAEFAIDDSHSDETPPYVLLVLESTTDGDVVGTEDIKPGVYEWDFQETRNSKPRTPIGGKVTVTRDATQ